MPECLMGWGALKEGLEQTAAGAKLWAKEYAASRLQAIGECFHDALCVGSMAVGSMRTLPSLPGKVIAREGEVAVVHYYRSGDHGPAHAHVQGGGAETRVGPKGFPLRGDPELTVKQQQVVNQYAKDIRKAINKIGRWLAGQEQ
jgi:hypothetical protein